MSGRAERRSRGRARAWRRRLAESFDAGQIITTTLDAPGEADVRQTIGVGRAGDGSARVDIEWYHATEWDHTIRLDEHTFPDLGSALAWLRTEFGIDEADLRLP